ncbi:MAG: PilT/PilU family type 4a pilus ATPase [Candidatus Brocadiaceae bacterium]
MEIPDDLVDIMKLARKYDASDIHIVAGVPPAFRIDGEIILADAPPLSREETAGMVRELLGEAQRRELEREMELCFSIPDSEYGRFRVAVYCQERNPEMAIRRCRREIPAREELGLPPVVEEMARKKRGLVLITGPTGMGKTTTLNFMIDLINGERRCKIVTIEDPIEFVHRRKKAIVVQQEVHTDTRSFSRALVHVLRQDPDVICVGEMRDLETISTALTAAETGHLVLATLHTPNAAQTVERIVAVFPAEQQNQITAQLANCIEGVIAQLLLPRPGKSGRALATEILVANTAVRRLIREGDLYKVQNVIQTGRKSGMQTMDDSLRALYERGEVSYDTAVSHARDPDAILGKKKAGQVLD